MTKINILISFLKQSPKTVLLILVLAFLVLVFITLSLLFVKNLTSPTTTSQTVTLTPDEKVQEKSDIEFGQKIEAFTQKYPWYDNLPSKNSKYYVVFDYSDETFNVNLYTKSNPSLVESYKNQVFLDLAKIGIATTSFKFNWMIK